ncbi:DNA polymerase III subunit gamma/tau [Glaciibacter psychrotolerans]|uniref:DNA polymerase III subunit gamma/tau n=1 Tax=Glaciibacter psychrotolerans TaxID=670054 RepID=A0A7Z0J654_9MICO|nr:DNA polymerase III subunit gamma/tau [Leifsonia psychrotolerans]NYJ19568.1 hypothetical protein [Leifsonia psychrotolerans]
MTPKDEPEDALSWAGDDDPTLAPGPSDSAELPEGWTVVGPATAQTAQTAQTTHTQPVAAQSAERPQVAAEDSDARAGSQIGSSIALVGLGVLGGIYLLYTIGWFVGVSRIRNPLADPVGEFMFTLGTWLAVAAAPLWFGATFWLTIDRRRVRILWLVIGVVLLVPIPFITGVGAL